MHHRTAFITGAASGIGLATAQALSLRGWRLGLADRDEDALHERAASLPADRTHRYALDVTDRDQLTEALAAFMKPAGGQLHVLLNSAGLLTIGAFESIDPKRHQAILDVNVMGVANACQAAFPYLKQTPGALVINMSSASALYGIPDLALYSASKAAVRSLTEALAMEWAPHGVRVCDVMPLFVNTHMVSSQAQGAPVLDRLGVHLEADDVVKVILQQIEAPQLHRSVGFPLNLLHVMSDAFPRWLTWLIIRLAYKGL